MLVQLVKRLYLLILTMLWYIVVHTKTEMADYATIVPTAYSDEPTYISYELGKSRCNPHFHIILDSEKKEKTIRASFNVLAKKRNEKNVSLTKVQDKDKAFRYNSKDKNIVFNSIISQDEQDRYILEAKRIQKEYKKTIAVNNLKMIIDDYVPLEEVEEIFDIMGFVNKPYLEKVNKHIYDFILSRGDRYSWYNDKTIQKMIYTAKMRHYPAYNEYNIRMLTNREIRFLSNLNRDDF